MGEAPEYVCTRTKNIIDTPDKHETIEIEFRNGDPVGLNNIKLKPHEILTKLNHLAGKHGIGRIDIVENRFVGMKSRGIYETPGGTILINAHRAIESITLDKGEAHIKDEIMPKYAELIYNGFWFSSERLVMQKLIDSTQLKVNGLVKLKLFKGNVFVIGRKSKNSLYDNNLVSFDEKGNYNQKDAEGFIKINSIRLKKAKNLVKMGYGDDLLITAFFCNTKKLYPNRQIVIGNTKKRIANHSGVFDNNPNIADCRNLDKNKDIHVINYHSGNRPYIDYLKSKKQNTFGLQISNLTLVKFISQLKSIKKQKKFIITQ